MSLNPQIPAAPIDMLMPATALTVYTLITYSLLAVATVVLARESRRTGSWLPLCALLGGAISVLLELIFDVILLLWYPDKNTTPLFRADVLSLKLTQPAGCRYCRTAPDRWAQ